MTKEEILKSANETMRMITAQRETNISHSLHQLDILINEAYNNLMKFAGSSDEHRKKHLIAWKDNIVAMGGHIQNLIHNFQILGQNLAINQDIIEELSSE